MSNQEQVKLSELISEKPRNGLYKAKEFQGKGHRWVKMNEIYGSNFFLNQKTELLEVTESEINRFNCQSGDLLFGRTSLTLEGIGDCLLVGDVDDVPIFESNLLRIRFNLEIAYPLFYYYFFKSKGGRLLIQTIAKQTAATSITSTDLITLPVPYFPIDVQKEIADQIHLFDNKIELSRQTNQTLENIAQAIFKSWFVDFEPTRAKVIVKEKGGDEDVQSLAAQAVICGAITLDQLSELSTGSPKMEDKLHSLIMKRFSNTPSAGLDKWTPDSISKLAGQFPNTIVESELGEIPRGWALECVGDHLTVTKGRSYKSIELEESNTALVTLKSFMRGGGYREDGLKAYIGTYKPEQVIEPGELVMSLTDVTQAAEIVGKPAIVTRNDAYETLVASLDVAILRPNQSVMKEFFYGLMSTYRFHRYAESFATGTTVLHLNPKGIASFEFPMPDSQLCKVYSDIVGPMLAKHEGNIHLSRSLEATKNVLLPRLLSGELEISPKETA